MTSKVAILGVIAIARDGSDLLNNAKKWSILAVIEIARDDSDL